MLIVHNSCTREPLIEGFNSRPINKDGGEVLEVQMVTEVHELSIIVVIQTVVLLVKRKVKTQLL